MQEILIRVVLGGLFVSVFSSLGDVLKPKSFAGLFGAAPSIALATLALSIRQHGRSYGSTEALSMILGALAFFIYASAVSRLMMRKHWPALAVTSLALLLWLGTAFGLWYGLLS